MEVVLSILGSGDSSRLHQRLACLRQITRSVYGLRGRLAQRNEIQRLDLPLAGSRIEERSHLPPGDEQAHQALRPGDQLTKTLRGKEEDLKFYTDNLFIDQLRGGVNTGGKMTRKRTIHDLRKIARARQSDWWARLMDETLFIYLSGARGVNADFIEDTVAMGCMVCPSFIVCKEADVSIGVTASDNKLNEFGYNSVFVRNRELSGVMKKMVQEGKLLRRPMWENRGRLLRKFVERMIPSKDAIGIAEYVRTGSWQHSADTLKKSSSAQGGRSGRIMGLQRLLLTQTVKRKIMYEPAISALKNAGKFLTDMF